MSVKTPYLIGDFLFDLGILPQTLRKQATKLFIKNAALRPSLTSSGLAGALGGLTSGGAKGLLTNSTKLLSLTLDTAFTVVGAIWTVGTFLAARSKRKAAQRKRERGQFRQEQIDTNKSRIEDIINYSRSTGKLHPSSLGQSLEGNLDYDKAEQLIKDYARIDSGNTLRYHLDKSFTTEDENLRSQRALQKLKEKKNEEISQI